MEYLSEIIWYASWPITIFVALKFVQLNVTHLENIVKLETMSESSHS